MTGSEVLKLAVYNATGSSPQSVANAVPQQDNPGAGDAPELTTITQDVPVSVTFDGVAAGTEAQLTVLSAQDNNGTASVLPGEGNPLTQYTLTLTADQNGVYRFTVPDLSVVVLETKGDKGDAYNGQWGQGGYGGCQNGGQRASYDWQAWLASGQEGTGCQ